MRPLRRRSSCPTSRTTGTTAATRRRRNSIAATQHCRTSTAPTTPTPPDSTATRRRRASSAAATTPQRDARSSSPAPTTLAPLPAPSLDLVEAAAHHSSLSSAPCEQQHPRPSGPASSNPLRPRPLTPPNTSANADVGRTPATDGEDLGWKVLIHRHPRHLALRPGRPSARRGPHARRRHHSQTRSEAARPLHQQQR